MTDAPTPPRGTTPLARRQARLAWGLLAPTLIAVALVVVLPLMAIFWISFKPIGQADLRPPTVRVSEAVRGAGEDLRIQYRVINSSQDHEIRGVAFTDILVPEVQVTGELPEACALDGLTLSCDFGTIPGGHNERFEIPIAAPDADAAEDALEATEPLATGEADSILLDFTFTLENYERIIDLDGGIVAEYQGSWIGGVWAMFDASEFFEVLWVTLAYTIFGTLGALIFGLFAAQLLERNFRGKGILRGLFLFPYVAPVIAVAFAWLILLDPIFGSLNHLLVQMGVTEQTINFFGQRPLALIMVILFEVWRYFPLSFLFILARMQSIPDDIYEAADMDGASPFQQFWFLSLPQLLGILSVLFLLRFIWTFNKFDDIFLLTGGNAGTRTLTVNVYEQAFAVENIGAGAAVAVIIFLCLLAFAVFFFRALSREEGL